MDSELVFLHFESTDDADHAMGAIRGLEAEGFLALDEAALIRRDNEGSVTVKPYDHGDQARSTSLGGAVGLVAGGLLGLPLVGLVAGASIAAKKAFDRGHLDQMITDVGSRLTPGTAVLALSVTELSDPEIVADRMQVHREAIVRVDVPPTIRELLDEAGDSP